ncbi:MAG: hypothetical protein RE468_04200 [Acidithiobacillus caldus]|uniref:TonB C-terminal domain-containing protein n=1 Tax=Acidithiobacillus caldus TaxID=33059 RepID=A0A1E7YST4_9PROT|nr:hypothetical protein [Acidithiobacillus caldus]OFC30647.1 hypothetical protein BAE28_13285 [Acidithiobacillus caldus]OFC37118.1 hypothetical protein BAE27_04405 [Acidithiobacillus caldus]OFC37733.1 hypothetical protein BAE29_09955 [Acidithiobacillus caldus]OFC49429.1 hypothetical protein BAE30_13165 [Acidithiobacillus caldus]WMT47821.1 MAG: hypothetical protein RE468_04200 [Acidithiobacillus caldus]
MKNIMLSLLPALFLSVCAAEALGANANVDETPAVTAYATKVSKILAPLTQNEEEVVERQVIRVLGHPLPAKTGLCMAKIDVRPNGSVAHFTIMQCHGDVLGSALSQAIELASLPPTPFHHQVSIFVGVDCGDTMRPIS